jgi:hypothetical protein
MRKLLFIIGLLVLFAVASASTTKKDTYSAPVTTSKKDTYSAPVTTSKKDTYSAPAKQSAVAIVKKVELKQQTVVVKQTMTTASKKVASHVCDGKDGKEQVDCTQKATKTVQQSLTKVQKKADDTIKTCGCTEKSSHECSNTDTATEDITQCQCDYVEVCNKDCLSNSVTYQGTVAKETKKVLSKVCGGNDDASCHETVKSHFDDANSKLKKVAVKVSQIKVKHQEIVSDKVKLENKCKEVAITKHKQEIKDTVHTTCDKVAKTVCEGLEGPDYVDCNANTVSKVKTYLKKVETNCKSDLATCAHKSCVKETLKVNTEHKKTTSIATSLCGDDNACAEKVKKNCDGAVTNVRQVTGKIHVVKVTKVTDETKKKLISSEKKEVKKSVTDTCDKVAKLVCLGKEGPEYDSCHKKTVKVAKKQFTQVEQGAKKTTQGMLLHYFRMQQEMC